MNPCVACGMTAVGSLALSIDWYEGDFPTFTEDEFDYALCRGCALRIADGETLLVKTEEQVSHLLMGAS